MSCACIFGLCMYALYVLCMWNTMELRYYLPFHIPYSLFVFSIMFLHFCLSFSLYILHTRCLYLLSLSLVYNFSTICRLHTTGPNYLLLADISTLCIHVANPHLTYPSFPLPFHNSDTCHSPATLAAAASICPCDRDGQGPEPRSAARFYEQLRHQPVGLRH